MRVDHDSFPPLSALFFFKWQPHCLLESSDCGSVGNRIILWPSEVDSIREIWRLFWAPDPAVIVEVFRDSGGGWWRGWGRTSVYLPATTTGLILTNCSRHVSADTPPPAYMPPDEQMGQESQSMDTSNNLVPPSMARGGESCTPPPLLFGMKSAGVNL